MRRLALIAVAISSLLVVPLWASELVQERKKTPALRPDYVPGELLVKYRPSVRAAASEYFRSRWGVSTLRSFTRIGVQHVKLPKGMTVEEGLEIYGTDPDVEYAEPNYLRYATATSPNDTFFGNLWGLDNVGDTDIDAPEAWDTSTGNSNVVVAVIDSGVDYNHPDLTANIWANPGEIPGNGLDDDGNGYVDDVQGWDFVDNDNDPMDADDHGTHVAGTVAAEGDNSTGVTGVSWTARIMVLRFLDAFGSGTVADEIEAIDYAIDNGANIINASYGSYSFSPSERDAISRARTAGILFVAAAGNDSWNNDSVTTHYPSSYDLNNIIAVAATDQNDSRAFFSNFGATTVDVSAPGTNVLSARPDRQTVWSEGFEGAFTWSTGGTNNFWGVTSEYRRSGSNSLTDYPNNDYLDGTDSWAQTPVIDLSSHAGSKLTFWLRGNSQSNDYFFVQGSSDGSSWTDLTLEIGGSLGIFWSGSSSSFIRATADLGSFDGTATFYLRFNFNSNSDASVAEGWFFDDVEVTAADTTYSGGASDYQYFQGTSMATPHVAGLAALIWGLDLGQTFAQVKQRILNGVEVKSGLNGMILTGGRINADNSVRNVPTPPSSLSAKVKSSSKIKLTWSDNSYGEDGFKIERKTDVGGIYAQVAVAAANSTSYTDTGLEKSTTYFYRIMAYRGTNNSEISNEANSTTSASDGGGGGGGGGGGCFITTAAFGSPTDTHVGVLRNSRARFPLSNRVGKMLARLYNHWSAALADFIEERETARVLTRWTLYPLVGLASIALHTTVGQQIAMGLTFLAIFYLVRFRRKSWC